MEINIADKYILTADQYQYILRERKIVQEGKTAGQVHTPIIGYYSKLSHAVSAMIHLNVRESDIKLLQEMNNHIKTFSEQIEADCAKVLKGK